MTHESIFIFTPTYDKKEYCLEEFIKGILALDADGFINSTLILDTSRENQYFNKLSDRFSEFPGITVSHYETHEQDTPRQVHATALNMGRSIFLQNEFDYFLSIEADVVPNPKDLLALFEAMKDTGADIMAGVVPYSNSSTMLYKNLCGNLKEEYGPPLDFHSLPSTCGGKIFNLDLYAERYSFEKWQIEAKAYEMHELDQFTRPFQVAGCALGFTLIKRNVLEQVVFRMHPESIAFADVWFSWDAKRKGFHLYCHPNVRPNHLWRKWEHERLR